MHPGGLPRTLDDLIYIQESLQEAIALAAKRLGVNTYFIDRPVLTNGATTTYTAGSVMIDGVVYEIDANNAGIPPIGSNIYIYIEPVVTYDPAGAKQFADGNTKQCYEVTKMKLMSYNAAQVTTNPLFLSVPHLNDLIGGIIEQRNNKYSKLQSLGLGAAVAVVGGLVVLGTDGNSFDVQIGANDTLTGINIQMPAGTQVTLRFVGANSASIVKVVAGAGMQTAGSLNYTFRSGQSATFISLDSGSISWQLVTAATSDWTVPGALSGTWTVGDQVRYRVTADGRVEFNGSISGGASQLVLPMPAGLRTKLDTALAIPIQTSGGTAKLARITAFAINGNIAVEDVGGGYTGVEYCLTGFSYYIQ